MNNWTAPQRPNTYAEHMLISAILDGSFPPGSTLPGERNLAVQLGITRPTLREAIQRLSRDGWLTVSQGKATLVNDFWREGGLNVLSALVQHSVNLPSDFVANLLEVRLQLAPAYTYAAVEREPGIIAEHLGGYRHLYDEPGCFATFDWNLHRRLTFSSGNQIYTLILNGFSNFYEQLARIYFSTPQARAKSLDFYTYLENAAENMDANLAQEVCRQAMLDSLEVWEQVKVQSGTDFDAEE